MNFSDIERIIAIAGGLLVFVISVIAFWFDRKAVGLDNQVFKIMLVLLAVGALIALLAGAGVLGNFPKAA